MLVFIISIGFLNSSLYAATIVISNNSFESETIYNGGNTSAITGWNTPGTGSFGFVTNESARFTSGLEGNNSIFLNGQISQNVGATFIEGETYTLTVSIGRPSGVALLTGGEGLSFGFKNATDSAFLSGTGSTFVDQTAINGVTSGSMNDFTLNYVATASDAGQNIIIGANDFFSVSSADEFQIDNFRLSTTAIPEPSVVSLILLTLGMLFCQRRASNTTKKASPQKL